MENASKALMIAGGVLIAVLIIGLLVYMFASGGGLAKEKEQQELILQMKAFNEQYEAYNRSLLRGTDVISVMNKAISNNTKYGLSGSNEPEYQIQVEFEMKEELVYTQSGTASVNFKVGERYNIDSFSSIKNNTEAFTDFKRRIFDCKEVRHHKTTGRVNYMLFIERKMSDSEYQNGIIYK